MSEEEINKVDKILSCDNCPTSYACEGCDITWTDKNLIKKYISELEISNKELDKENNRLEKIEFERDMANKIIDEMTKVIIASSICDYFIKDNCKYYAGENKKLCDECIKQYFEKKVEGK